LYYCTDNKQGERGAFQTRGIKGLRRIGENTNILAIKAVATGANNALIGKLFKLC